MLINHYPYAVTRLLFRYRKGSDFHNEEKCMEGLRHAAVNAVEIDRELLGLSEGTNDSFFNKLFKE